MERAVTRMWKTSGLSTSVAKNVYGWLRACCIYFASPHISLMANDVAAVFRTTRFNRGIAHKFPWNLTFLWSAVMFRPSRPLSSLT
jgi:hypothetical protein